MPVSKRHPPRSRAHAKVIAKNPFVGLLGTVQKEVDLRLAAFLDTRVDEARILAPEVGEMMTALSDLCRRGGKRLRPALLVTGYRVSSQRADLELALDVGVALELLQAYFLIHDDWMDGDSMRRGGPTAHTWLARRLKSQHKGAASAILAGDYAAALALEVLAGLEIPPKKLGPVLGAFAEMQLAAVAGQQIDLVGQSRDIELGYTLKTGSYTVLGPMKLGALLAGASRTTLAALARIARPLGVAFQLRDDLLSAFGDSRVTGKALGNDLRAGKRTLLLVEALSRSRGAAQKTIRFAIGNEKATKAELAAALAAIDASGARARVEERISELSLEAARGIGPGLSQVGAELIHGAISALTERGA